MELAVAFGPGLLAAGVAEVVGGTGAGEVEDPGERVRYAGACATVVERDLNLERDIDLVERDLLGSATTSTVHKRRLMAASLFAGPDRTYPAPAESSAF